VAPVMIVAAVKANRRIAGHNLVVVDRRVLSLVVIF
jgi:hypothetical protein